MKKQTKQAKTTYTQQEWEMSKAENKKLKEKVKTTEGLNLTLQRVLRTAKEENQENLDKLRQLRRESEQQVAENMYMMAFIQENGLMNKFVAGLPKEDTSSAKEQLEVAIEGPTPLVEANGIEEALADSQPSSEIPSIH